MDIKSTEPPSSTPDLGDIRIVINRIGKRPIAFVLWRRLTFFFERCLDKVSSILLFGEVNLIASMESRSQREG